MPAAGRGFLPEDGASVGRHATPSFLASALVTQATILFKTPLGLRAGERRLARSERGRHASVAWPRR
jgi:hypothetical protein